MKDFNKEKAVIGIVGDTLEQAKWFATNLGGVELPRDMGRPIYFESEKFIFECHVYSFKGGTPRWDGIIFACDTSIDRDKTNDWLNTVR